MFGFSKVQLGFTLALLLAIGLLCGAVYVQDAKLDTAAAERATLTLQRDNALEVNAANAAEMDRLKAEYAKANAIAYANAEDARSAQTSLDALKAEIANVPDPPPSSPPCALPATQLVFDRLRERSPKARDRDPSRPAPGAGPALRLQGRSGSAEKGH